MYTHSFRGRGRAPSRVRALGFALFCWAPSIWAPSIRAQSAPVPNASDPAPGVHELDSLVARATAVSPAIRAALARVEAARARIRPAGARPDPMLMAGFQNVPVSSPSLSSDDMTMKMVGVSQTIPLGGKLALRTQAVEYELAAAEARLAETRLAVERDARAAYFDLVFATRAFEITSRTQTALAGLVTAAESRYAAGAGQQSEALHARVEAARMAAEASALAEERRMSQARLNALLARPAETPFERVALPASLVRAALGDTTRRTRFVSPMLGARVADSPLPPLDSLEALVLRVSPRLAERRALMAAQAAREELARRERRPDIDVSLQYGQRAARPDMISAIVSLELPVRRSRRQDAMVAEARSELAASAADVDAEATTLRAEVARWYGETERARAQLLLLRTAVLPSARATLASTAAALQGGRVEFTELIEAQATIFNAEVQYHRALTDFAKALAELQAAGTEVLR